ncbi:MAG: hypothetical protein K2Y37_01700 [Pirellulales bacterium]|nr:hypothetical protein [Pirellulales bacterium]
MRAVKSDRLSTRSAGSGRNLRDWRAAHFARRERLARCLVACGVALLCALPAIAADPAASTDRPAQAAPAELFPPELVRFKPYEHNPVFTGAGPGHWDVRIRERGWILREPGGYRMWYTGYDATREGRKHLGLATSDDGLAWTRWPANPLDRDHWIEDMQVLRDGDTYYMFAEGERDQAHWFTSPDGIKWQRRGTLDIRKSDGEPISPGPFGTPFVLRQRDRWLLFYERMDLGIWLATSSDLTQWRHVQDEPVFVPGPEKYDHFQVAFNQVIERGGRYYAYYHARESATTRDWSTNLAASDDLVHWTKYPRNPILEENKSSPLLLDDGKQLRLYTTHDQVQVHFSQAEAAR